MSVVMTGRDVPSLLTYEPIALAIPDGSPMVRWRDGTVRIGASRVHFWLIARCLLAGESEASVASDFPTVSLDDVHAVHCYIEGHKVETAEYLHVLEEQEAAIAEAMAEWQRRHPHPVLERLRAAHS